MKKALFLLLLSLAMMSAFGAIICDSSISSELSEAFEREYESATNGRSKVDIALSGYKEETLDDGIYITVLCSEDSNDIELEGFASTLNGAYESIAHSLYSYLYYNTSLYSDSPMILDYQYSGSYSLKETGLRRGERVVVYDDSDKVRGVFLLSDHYSGYDLLKPIYLGGVLPGMKAEKASSFDWSLGYALSIPLSEHYITASFGNTSWIYPMKPFLTLFLNYNQLSNQFSVYSGIGLSARATLGEMFNTSFTLLEEGSICADASLLFSLTDFKFYGSYSLYYEHRALSFLSWKVGYTYTPGLHGALMVAFGGDL